MIEINDPFRCCGCSACNQGCPKHCISLHEDEQGFLYPIVNMDLCINCGKCEKVCPCLNTSERHEPLKIIAATHPSEVIRMQSSSGGVFTMIAEAIIDEGGVVFGSRFDKNWEVIHDYADTKEGLQVFRGSKYVQSRIGNTYKQALDFLKEGRKVLFSGTPCQIEGLKRFLRRDYDKLLTIEIACHGVPSPKVWRHYLSEVANTKKIESITAINFRNKKYGWNCYHFSLDYIKVNGKKETMIMPHGDNPFYRGYLNHLYIRPSCYACPSKDGRSGADITISDFWGIDRVNPKLNDDRGVSTIYIHTEKGLTQLEGQCEQSHKYQYNEIIQYNPALVKSIKRNPKSQHFWESKEGVIRTVERLCGDSFTLKIKKQISRILHRLSDYKL